MRRAGHAEDTSGRALERGFTLIELVVVVALLGILAGISVMNVRAALLMTRVTATTSELKLLREGLPTLGIDCGTRPRSKRCRFPRR